MTRLLLLVCVSIATVQGRVGDTCRQEGECGEGECCQILSPSPVVSRRQLEPVRLDTAPTQGTCQLYKTENATCNSFEQVNGYCGCGPGMTCHGAQVKLDSAVQPVGRRSIIARRPGYTWEFKCTATAQ